MSVWQRYLVMQIDGALALLVAENKIKLDAKAKTILRSVIARLNTLIGE